MVRIVDAGGVARYLIVKPHGKGDGAAPYVLPRGTRMYRDPQTGDMVDARDDVTAARYADFLEATEMTAARELEEEAGVPHDLFDARNPKEIGQFFYESPTGKGRYLVAWYGVNLLASDTASLRTAIDSAEVRWMTLSEYETHAQNGAARAGYVDIIKRAEAVLSQ